MAVLVAVGLDGDLGSEAELEIIPETRRCDELSRRASDTKSLS